MKLTVLTPTKLVLDAASVRRLRAADATGEFGVRPGHGDFLTLLEPSVIDFTDQDGATRYVAVAGGILSVEGGERIEVLTEDAVVGTDLAALEATALDAFEHRARAERAAATGLARLHVALVRRLESFLRPGGAPPAAAGFPSRPAEVEP